MEQTDITTDGQRDIFEGSANLTNGYQFKKKDWILINQMLTSFKPEFHRLGVTKIEKRT